MANKRLSSGSSLIKTGLTKTAAKNAAQAARKPATTVTARPTTGITRGGNRTAAKNGYLVDNRTPTMSSYAGKRGTASKSGTAKNKLY